MIDGGEGEKEWEDGVWEGVKVSLGEEGRLV